MGERGRIRAVALSEVHSDPYEALVSAVMLSGHFVGDELAILEAAYYGGMSRRLVEGRLDEASLKQWIEDKGKKAVDAVKDKALAAKDAGVQLMSKIGTSFSTFIKYVLQRITEFLKAAWEWTKRQVNSAYAPLKEDVIKKVKESKYDAKTLKTEIDQFKDMAKVGAQYLTGGVVTEMAQGMAQAGSEDVGGKEKAAAAEPKKETEKAAESLMYESLMYAAAELVEEDPKFVGEVMSYRYDEAELPGISKLTAKLAHLPPFKWLHGIEDTVKKKTNNAFNNLSAWLHERAGAGGPYEFALIGSVAGILAGTVVESGLHHAAEELGFAALAVAIPGLGLILALMGWIAKGLWVAAIAETALEAIETVEP